MPELPEVEVVKKSLLSKIIKLKVKKVKVKNVNLRYKIDKKSINSLKNKKIISIKRISKYLLINFSNDITLISHLGMTGRFYIEEKKKILKSSFYYNNLTKLRKHDHVVFIFNNRLKIIYNDIRKFGFLMIAKTSKLKNYTSFIKLGPDPLKNKFNFKYFKEKSINKKIKIKDLLMNQSFVSGLGNIYVNEILFKSKINPYFLASNLKDVDIKKIVKYTKNILLKAIKHGGSSIKDFHSFDGAKGHYQEKFYVYGKTGLQCSSKDCKALISKVVISQRATFYCPNCQK